MYVITVCYDNAAMKKNGFIKFILLTFLMSVLTAGTCYAEGLTSQNSFPFTVSLGQDAYDKLCYAGHVMGGGIFYDDGYMITPSATFTVNSRYASEADNALNGLSVEIDLIYENSDNTSCVREVIKKYDYGNVKNGKEYPLLSDTAIKSLKQRRKLYSSDVMSIKMILTYKGENGTQKKQAFLFYMAKDSEYKDKRNVLAAPPETE